MFSRPITQAENLIKDQTPYLIPQLKDPQIRDGLRMPEAKRITTSFNLYNYNAKTVALSDDMPRHSMGYDFGYDKTIEPMNPAKAIPNPQTPADILSRIAQPDLPIRAYTM